MEDVPAYNNPDWMSPVAQKEAGPPPVRRSKWVWLGGSAAILAVAAVALVALWDWNWFLPLIDARASAALGRPVTIGKLEIHPGRLTGITVYNVKVANPEGFQGADFATISQLSFTFEPLAWLRTGQLVLRTVDADQPTINIEQTASGQGNWIAPGGSSTLKLGELAIQNGVAHVHVVRQESNVTMSISTSRGANGDVLIVDGKGTHARQPITFHAVGGALLALRDAASPYPIDLELANGETRVTLKGHISDPMALTGADLNLVLSGPDMALLLPLTGIATPSTPPYRISGHLHFRDGKVDFAGMTGRTGSSDLEGELDVDPHGGHPIINAKLSSHEDDLADLGGFVGSVPGRATTPGQTAAQIKEHEQAKASPRLMPTVPISLPKVRAADVHLVYRGDKILGKNVPFDSISAKLDITDGRVRVAPLRLGIGRGAISGTIDITPVGDAMEANADITAERVDISRLLASAGLGHGQGYIDGTAKIKGRGASLAAVLADGDGMVHAVMPSGGDINSLLVDLLGIELGKAFFAAIGVPGNESITCAVADFVLQHGILASRMLEVDTSDHVVTGGGRIDLSRELMEMTLRADPRRFTIGSLPTPVVISGTFKDLHFGLAPQGAARAGAAVGLGLLFPPAAILPTIQFGVGQNSPCAQRANR